MTNVPIHDVWFGDSTTLAMGKAFDQACKSLRSFSHAVTVREIIAKRIIEAATYGERDPVRLYEQALKVLGTDEIADDPRSVGSKPTSPAYAPVALCA